MIFSLQEPDCETPQLLSLFPDTKNYSQDSTQIFVWELEDGSILHYDLHEAVRFQIDMEFWHDQTPIGPNEVEEDVKQPPYTMTASMQMEGLGPCLWWDESSAAEG